MPELKRPDGAVIHYEVLGEGDPVLCLGGWGTFCHGHTAGLPFGLLERYQVILMDYRGIGNSTDNYDTPATMEMYADDAIAVLDAVGARNVHLLGMVGIGACVCQQIAVRRPDIGRSLVNTGAWVKMDPLLEDQLNLFLDVHRDAGWATFQRLVCAMSFSADYYNANAARLIGPQGPWRELMGKTDTHARFIAASVIYDAVEQLKTVTLPALVMHAPLDIVTGPRTTRPIEDALPNATSFTIEGAAHVLAGKEQRGLFSQHLFAFYDRV